MRLKFVSIPAVFLFFISTVSTFLIRPATKSLRSYTSSSYRTVPYKYEISATQADVSVEPTSNKYQSVEKLAELCHTFASKNIKQSITSGRTQWADDDLFQQIIASLDATSFLTASTFGSFLLLSPFPTNSIIFQGNNYALSLLMIPRGVEVQLPTSDKDNTFIYKPLRGLGELRKQKEQGNSEVIRMNGNDDFNTLYNDVLIESGGDRRNFYSQHSNSGPSVLLELSFNQGTAADFVETGTESNQSIQKFTLIQPPASELNQIFESSEDNENRNKEMIRRNALFSENAKKYDILDRIRYRVGGLSSELGDLVRRVLSSRQISSNILKNLGINHIKGILLYGPPGTGKTLIARELAKALNSREPLLVNGPEIMDKYVGEAERNIRDLFKPAEEEWAMKGAQSELHVIIFDEFDSVAKKRGSLSGDGSGVRDSCVNQLLSKLDGVDEMNNVLVICLTNRKDLIDSALLRPGRLEVHIEIKAPDLQGREEILYILFKPMVLGGYVTLQDAKKWIKWVAGRTFGYTGADLTGLVRNAASHAIERTLEQQHTNYYSKSNENSTDRKDSSMENANNVNISNNQDNDKNDKVYLNSNSDVTTEHNQLKPFEDSIEVSWNDIEKAFFESKKDMKISKRAQFISFINSTLRRKDKNNDNKKIKKREFEDILNSVDVEVEVEELESLDRDGNENNLIDENINPIKPAFQNIGGTLIF